MLRKMCVELNCVPMVCQKFAFPWLGFCVGLYCRAYAVCHCASPHTSRAFEKIQKISVQIERKKKHY